MLRKACKILNRDVIVRSTEFCLVCALEDNPIQAIVIKVSVHGHVNSKLLIIQITRVNIWAVIFEIFSRLNA